jgi:hypothetical protein
LICDFAFSSRLSASAKEATAEGGPPQIENQKSQIQNANDARRSE